VGLFDRLGLTRKRFDALATVDIASPFQDSSTLNQVILSDLFGEDLLDTIPLGREAAIAIPAVSKARNLLVSTVSKFPLVALNEAGPLRKQPAWLYRTNSPVSPYERMAWTVDDCIFNGVSLWATERGEADASGRRPILDATWVPPRDWKITEGNILVNDEPVNDEDVILFNPPFEGLLNIGRRTLRGARDIELAWTARIRNPIHLTELRITDDTNLSQTEVDAWEAAWLKKHRAGEPSFGVTPAGAQIETHGGENDDSAMFMESRNAIRTDVGSFLNIRASMLDGTSGIDSLTYTTKDGERNLFYELDLPFWTDPIEAALSQDKCVPRGTRVRFDKYELYTPNPSPTGAPEKD
jgi:hypothetical protein